VAGSSIVAPRTPELEKVSVACRWLQWTVQENVLRIQKWGSLFVDLVTCEQEGKTKSGRGMERRTAVPYD